MDIYIYGQTQACLETYERFSDTIRKNLFLGSQGVHPKVIMVRSMAEIGENHEAPVVVINGKIISEESVPSVRRINTWLVKHH